MKVIITLFSSLLFLMSSLQANELKPYRVYIKPNTVLKKIKGGERLLLENGIFAYVLDRDFIKRDFINVYDQKGNPLYEIKSEDMVEFESDIALFPNHKANTKYPIPSTFQAANKNLYFDTQFNIHFDQINTKKFSEINSEDNTSSIGNRFEIKTKVLALFPVDFGISVNYESSTWSNNFEDVSLSIFSFGPYLQKSFYEEDNFQAFVSLGAEVAPIYKTKSTFIEDDFDGILIDLGIEGLWETQYGKWSLGTHYRRHDITLTSGENKGAQVVPENIYIDTFGIMIGYKYEWKL